MSITGILIATAIVGGTGIFIGFFLGIAGKKFAVETDPREDEVQEALPGNNCGGCGFAGCSALAAAIVAGEAPVNQCPVGGEAVAAKIAAIMGTEVGDSKRMMAYVKCAGSCEQAKNAYAYSGVESCLMASYMQNGGPKACTFGCIGFGDCVKACEFDGIHIIDGISVVDPDACRACGKCAKACPKHLIELIPYDNKYHVQCASKERGKGVMNVCGVGCIGCKLCEKTCKFDAIHVEDNIARIDYDKCKNCGMCAKKCPRGIITKKGEKKPVVKTEKTA